MSRKELELSGTAQISEVNFEANPQWQQRKVETSVLGKISRIESQEKRLLRYKKSVEQMRNTGLLIHISAAPKGFVAQNSPELHNGSHYGALMLAFGEAVCPANKIFPRNPVDGIT